MGQFVTLKKNQVQNMDLKKAGSKKQGHFIQKEKRQPVGSYLRMPLQVLETIKNINKMYSFSVLNARLFNYSWLCIIFTAITTLE